MCGVNGIFRFRADGPPPSREELRRTLDAMAHRGPDGRGEWASAGGELLLGHLRLAIIDLSPQGAQPMASADGRFHITFNGEIYNYRELRAALPDGGRSLRTQSDTEVILALFAVEGPRAFGRLRGMFGLAIWDDREKQLTLARDPLGIKPLYYAQDGNTFRFASQVKALAAGGAIDGAISPAGVVGFLIWGSVPEPHTWLRDVRALPAGCALTVGQDGAGSPASYPLSHASASGTLHDALASSVQAHLVADVPVGIFLSAGLDSTLIAALAQQASSEPLRTFTVTVPEWKGTARDEGSLAAETARALGTVHEERALDRETFRAAWHEHLRFMDQPSIDGFNTYLVSRLAREAGLKVVLSGLGGDELFGSYPSFRDVPRWRRAAGLVRAFPGAAGLWPSLARTFRRSQPKLQGLVRYGRTLAGAYLLRRGLFLPHEIPALLPTEIATAGLAAYDPLIDAERFAATASDAWRAVHAMESGLYMRNQLLRDSDWASMAHGLELRVPLVDAVLERDVETLAFEPAKSLGKPAAAAAALPDMPSAILHRQKSGFALPFEWLEGTAGASGSLGSGRARAHAFRLAPEFGLPLRETSAA